MNHPETLTQPYRLPCVLASALFLAPIAAVAATGEAPGSTLHHVTYQGKEMIAEVSDNHVFLHGDILAFPNEVQVRGPVTHAASTHATPPSVTTPDIGTVRLWRRTHLTYTFASGLSAALRSQFKGGAAIWAENTSWQLTEAGSGQRADILIKPHATRCAATTGAPKDGSQASVVLSSQCTLRSMVHEIGHVVGMIHEHQRPDRDALLTLRADTLRYIQQAYPPATYSVVIQNLQPMHYNPGQPQALDTGSIMMYGSYPLREPMRTDLMQRGLPFYTRRDGSLIEASPARLSNKDIVTAEYLANLITTLHTLTQKY